MGISLLLYKPAKTENERFANALIAKASIITEIKKAAFEQHLSVSQKDIDLYHTYKNACKTMLITDHEKWVEVEKLISKKLQNAVKYFNNMPNAYDFYENMTNKVKRINANGLDPEKVLKEDDEQNYFLLVETVRDLRDFIKELNSELDRELYNKKNRASNIFDRMSNETCIKELRAKPTFYKPELVEEETK